MFTNSRRRWRQPRPAGQNHRAYQVEYIAFDHPVFEGILSAEQRLFQELALNLKQKGIDLITIMVSMQPGSTPDEFAWLKNQPQTKTSYEELRQLLIYLHHDMLVRQLDRLQT